MSVHVGAEAREAGRSHESGVGSLIAGVGKVVVMISFKSFRETERPMNTERSR